jgi:hypothetical protein
MGRGRLIIGSPTHTRTLVGSYDVHLIRTHGAWRIDRFACNLDYIDGNVDLEQAT